MSKKHFFCMEFNFQKCGIPDEEYVERIKSTSYETVVNLVFTGDMDEHLLNVIGWVG